VADTGKYCLPTGYCRVTFNNLKWKKIVKKGYVVKIFEESHGSISFGYAEISLKKKKNYFLG
jgi:hypothetical protein